METSGVGNEGKRREVKKGVLTWILCLERKGEHERKGGEEADPERGGGGEGSKENRLKIFRQSEKNKREKEGVRFGTVRRTDWGEKGRREMNEGKR